jgi:hypothetical protein
VKNFAAFARMTKLKTFQTPHSNQNPRLKTTISILSLAILGLCSASGEDEIVVKKFLQHSQVVGASECIECHESEIKAWQTSHHYANKDLHKSDRALEIARNMGITSAAAIRTSGLCTQCHFTVQKVGAGPSKVIDGVSCESCHGGAKDWLDIHNTGDRRDGDDTAAARAKRITDSAAGGMIRPEKFQTVAANCYSCHIITNEELVNKGGHPAKSEGFELVAWMSGEVQHNFFDSKGATNAAAPKERQRMLYIAGSALQLEYSLRGLARAKEKADYGKAMGRNCGSSRTQFNAIVEALGSDAPAELVAIGEAVNADGLLKFFNVDPLNAAADAVAAQLDLFAKNHDGSALGAIDSMISPEGKGKVFQP